MKKLRFLYVLDKNKRCCPKGSGSSLKRVSVEASAANIKSRYNANFHLASFHRSFLFWSIVCPHSQMHSIAVTLEQPSRHSGPVPICWTRTCHAAGTAHAERTKSHLATLLTPNRDLKVKQFQAGGRYLLFLLFHLMKSGTSILINRRCWTTSIGV